MPINPNVPIQTKGGVEANVQAHQAKERELMITTDTNNLYVGKGTGNAPVLVADSTIPNRVASLENKSATFFSTASDELDDSTNLDEVSNLFIANGLIRPAISKYEEDFTSDININLNLSSNDITTNNDVAELFQGTIGYVPTQVSNQYNLQSLYTQPFLVDNAEEVAVVTNFTTPTGITGWTTNSQPHNAYATANPPAPSSNEWLQTAIRDNGLLGAGYVDNVWIATYVIGTSNNSILRLTRKNGETMQNISTISIFTNGTYNLQVSDTNMRNIVLVDVTGFVVLYYPTSATNYAAVAVDKETMSVLVTRENALQISDGSTINGIDVVISSGFYHFLVSTNNTSNLSSVMYWRGAVGGGNLPLNNTVNASTSWLAQWRETAPKIYQVHFELRADGYINWVAFTRRTSLAVFFGVINASTGAQLRTTPTAQSSLTTYWNAAGVQNLNLNSSGNGTFIHDALNNQVYILSPRTIATGDLYITRVGGGTAGAPNGAVGTPTALTASPLDLQSARDIQALFVPTNTPNTTRTLHIISSRSDRKDIYQTTLTITTAPVYTITGNTHLFRDNGATSVISQINVVGSNSYFTSNSMKYKILFSYYNETNLIEYKDNIQPKLKIQPLDSNNNAIGDNISIDITNGVQVLYSFTPAISQIALKYDFYYPILNSSWIAEAGQKPYSVKISAYTLDKTLPIQSGGSGYFITKPLITDRIVKEVTLSTNEDIGTTLNNSIEWQVQALNNSVWYNISNGETVLFDEDDYGSQLRLKATLTYGEETTSLATVPYISRYAVDVKNVLTANDLLPLQVNMLKMGLKINALGTYTTTSFQKMMIDIFENTNWIDTGNTTATLSGGAYNAGGTAKIVTSLPETTTGDGVENITSAIIMAEYTGTINFYLRRGSGSWGNPVPIGNIISFTSGTPSNQIQIKAEMAAGSILYGWAYLYQ
jgi:hypothetical protein